MKLKGIKPVEQHVEKAVLGVCGAAFVGALVWQLFLTKSEVKVGPNTKALTNAFDPAKDEANKLATAVGAADPKLPEVPALTLESTLRLGKELPARAGTTVAMGPAPGIRVGAEVAKSVDVAVGLPAVQSPANVVAATYRNTIHPVEKLRTPELAALLPSEQPFDKASVSVEGVFDGVAFRTLLETDPDGAGPQQPVPLNWWRDPAGLPAVEIVAIELERKTIRNADGTTPAQDEIVVVKQPPGRPASLGRSLFEENARSAGDVPPLLEEVRAAGPQLLRPEFYEVIAGPGWDPPAEAVTATSDDGKSRELRSVKRRLAQLDKRIAEVQGQLGGPRGGARGGEGRRGAPPPASGGRGGRLGGGGSRGVDAPAPRELNESQRKAIEDNLKSLEQDRAELVAQVERLGGKDDAPVVDAVADEVSWLENKAIKVWTHDLTVQPGAVYQYRMRVVVNNPMFGRGLQDAQRGLAEQKLIDGAWSDWTAPVTIDRDREFFITSATDADPVTGRPKATAEVFVFYYGYYRSQGGSFEPGDMLNLRVNLPEMKLADMAGLEDAFKKGQLPGLSPVAAPVGGRQAGAGGGGGKGAIAPAPSDPDARRSSGGSASGGAAPTLDSIMKIEGPKSIAAGVDSVLLGVRGVPADGTARFQAVVRDLAKRVVAMAPDDSRSNPAYKRLEASVRSGREALEPKPEEKPQQPQTQPQGPRRPTPPPPPSGGGGGGGG